MVILAKWVGSLPNLTTNKTYTLLYADSGAATLIDDNGVVFQAVSLANPTSWQLVSVVTTGPVQLYP